MSCWGSRYLGKGVAGVLYLDGAARSAGLLISLVLVSFVLSPNEEQIKQLAELAEAGDLESQNEVLGLENFCMGRGWLSSCWDILMQSSSDWGS